MRSIRTIKVKLGENEIFDSTCEKFLSACNWISGIVFKTKQLNSLIIHKKRYSIIRDRFDLGSQLACSVPLYVTAAFRSQKSQGKWRETTFKRKVIPVVWKRDFSFVKNKGLCFWGKPVKIDGKKIPPVETWKDSKLQKKGKDWYLILCYDINIQEPKSEGCIVGVDSGIKRIFTATNSANSRTFTHSGGELNYRRRCIRRMRGTVQSIGSRSSRRLLQRMSGHEARLTKHLLHVASKKLVQYAEASGARRIVMEKLSSSIREDAINKGREFSDKVHRWPYAMGQFFVQYKAEAKGIRVINFKELSL